MKTKTLLKSRRGITPILATLLLIVIAVAAIVVTYAWIMTYMSSAGHQAGVMLYEANVRFYNGNKIDIDVGNSGTSDAEIIRVYVGDSPANLENKNTTQGLPIPLLAGDVVTLTVEYTWESGKTYYFRIVPRAGAPLEFSKKA